MRDKKQKRRGRGKTWTAEERDEAKKQLKWTYEGVFEDDGSLGRGLRGGE